MEYCEIPYTTKELGSDHYKENYLFLKKLEKQIITHRVFNHSFLIKFAEGAYNQDGVKFILKQFGKIVIPFTAAICKLMGNAPDIESRFMLMDNLYEELGNMKFKQSHPVLYLEMLKSLGINKTEFENTPTISSIRILNNTILDAVENKYFAIGCAWLGYGGELTIPNNFPYLIKGIKKSSFKNINMNFWERHGERDEGHSNDATTLLCINTESNAYFSIEEAIIDSLNLRAVVWDELEKICDEQYTVPSIINGKENIHNLPEEYKVLHQYYKALNNNSLEKMQENWSTEKTTSFTNPLGGIARGYDEVIASHNLLFNSPLEINVEYYDIEITKLNNGFSSVGRERGTITINEKCIDVGFRTSRLYINENGKYKQLHHHGSFENIETQEKIMSILDSI